MPNKAILVSDVHIKSRLWTNYSQIQGDSYKALELLANEADEDTVLISCGDLLDSNRPSSEDLQCIKEFLLKFKRFLYIRGNHDNCQYPFGELVADNGHHLDSVPYTIGNICLYGVDWQPSEDVLLEHLTDIRSSIETLSKDKTPVVIMHQAVNCFFSVPGVSVLKYETIFNILGDRAKVYVGDIHIHKKVEHNKQFICSPGPLVPQDIQQATQKQFYLQLCLQTGDYKPIPVNIRKYYFTDCDNIQTTLENIDKSCPLPPVVIVSLVRGQKLLKEWYSTEYILIGRPIVSEKITEKSVEPTTSVSIKDAVEAEIDATEPESAKKLKQLLGILMSAEKPDEVLQNLLKKWGIA